jgi:hypothetical protein
MNVTLVLIAVALATLALMLWRRLVAARRAEFIRSYHLPDGLFDGSGGHHGCSSGCSGGGGD